MTSTRASVLVAMLCLILADVAACGPSHAQVRTASFERDLDRIVARAAAEMVAPICKPELLAETVECGLLFDRWKTEAFYQDWSGTNCVRSEMDSGECDLMIGAAFRRAVRQRYPAGDPRQVEAICAQDGNCESALWAFELAWLNSHNARVAARCRQEMQERAAQGSADLDEIATSQRRIQAVAAGLQAFGENMRQR